jgi:monoamine oxidase
MTEAHTDAIMSGVDEVVIVGAGVSGLTTAWLLRQQGITATVLEARDRVGGRTRSFAADTVHGDLGAAWIWPHQRGIAVLADALGVTTYAQYDRGDALFETPHEVSRFPAPDAGGARRFTGGAQRLCERLAEELSPSVRTGARVERITQAGDTIQVSLSNGERRRTRHLVLALPPRVIAQAIRFEPPLAAELQRALQHTPTWMGGSAKAIVTYAEPFWRARGLSGFAVSQRGPLGELHDHSPEDGSAGAIMGFFAGVAAYAGTEDERRKRVLAQLARLYGPDASHCVSYAEHAWWLEDTSSAPDDLVPLREHPAYGEAALARGWWDDSLWFAASETAAMQGGYLDGAVEAAVRVARQLMAGARAT